MHATQFIQKGIRLLPLCYHSQPLTKRNTVSHHYPCCVCRLLATRRQSSDGIRLLFKILLLRLRMHLDLRRSVNPTSNATRRADQGCRNIGPYQGRYAGYARGYALSATASKHAVWHVASRKAPVRLPCLKLPFLSSAPAARTYQSIAHFGPKGITS